MGEPRQRPGKAGGHGQHCGQQSKNRLHQGTRRVENERRGGEERRSPGFAAAGRSSLRGSPIIAQTALDSFRDRTPNTDERKLAIPSRRPRRKLSGRIFGPFGEDERQGASLAAQGTVVVPLEHLRVIRATGEDAGAFLHNLFSNDVKKLGANEAQLTSFNSPKGRMLASMLVWRQGGDYLLAMSADIHAAMLKKLSMYVLRSKVRLLDDGSDSVLIGLAGPRPAPPSKPPASASRRAAGHRLRHRQRGAPRRRPLRGVGAHLRGRRAVEQVRRAGAVPAGTQAWQWLDIREGLPTVTQPVQEEFVAQMLNFDLIGGVSFNKGCYPGQEIVARTHYLGKLKKRMYRVHAPSAPCPRWAPTSTPRFRRSVRRQGGERRAGARGWLRRPGGAAELQRRRWPGPPGRPRRPGPRLPAPALRPGLRKRLEPSHYYIYYPVRIGLEADLARALYNAQAELQAQTGIAGRFLRKADDPGPGWRSTRTSPTCPPSTRPSSRPSSARPAALRR
jgi:folate-binding protein YgfZ